MGQHKPWEVLCCGLLVWCSHLAAAELVTYPAPPGIAPSPLYSVHVGRQDAMRDSFVYEVNNIGLAPYNWQGHGWNIRTELTTAWTSFDFRAPVTVRIDMVIPTPAWKQPAVRVLPSAYGIVPSAVKTVGNTYQVTLCISSPSQYSVEFFDAATPPDFATWVPPNPLLIFANPAEEDVPRGEHKNILVLRPGMPIPASGAWGTRDGVAVDTLYFSPGVYDLGQVPSSINTGIYVLHSNEHIYLAGGAYVKGAFATCPSTGTTTTRCTDASNVSIRGRGILSGENFKRDYTLSETNANADALDAPMLIDLQGSGVVNGAWVGEQDARVEGITLIQAPYYNIQMSGINNRVDDVKLISWYPSTDGIAVGYDYTVNNVEHPGGGAIENSFFKDGDDSVKLYSSGLRVRNVVIWQSNNAAAFQLGSNTAQNVDDVRVADSNVIHAEWNWPNMSNAVFAGRQGGKGFLGQVAGYHFEHIHVENESWQLMQIAVGPSIWEFGNTQLGSISNLDFSDISVADPQTLPDEFQSYDLPHAITGVRFRNVVVAGRRQPDPTITFDANRMMSLGGNTLSSPAWADLSGTVVPNVQVWEMVQGTPSSSPISAITTVDQPLLDGAGRQVVGYGDFFGDGYASPLMVNSTQGTLEVWKEPLNPAVSSESTTVGTLPPGYQFAGVGDFNDSGTTGVLLWNGAAQQALALVMDPTGQLVTLTTLQPGHASTWSVAGIGDFDKNGYSDVVLRDTAGNLEILYVGSDGLQTTLDLTPGQLPYTATPEYQNNHPTSPIHGHFDASWQVADVGTFMNGFADILWRNPTTGDVGMTEFSPVLPQKPVGGAVLATLPAGSTIQGLGDYNGDGAIDILYRNATTGEVGIWYLGWMGGNYYEPAPAIPVTVGPGWQPLEN